MDECCGWTFYLCSNPAAECCVVPCRSEEQWTRLNNWFEVLLKLQILLHLTRVKWFCSSVTTQLVSSWITLMLKGPLLWRAQRAVLHFPWSNARRPRCCEIKALSLLIKADLIFADRCGKCSVYSSSSNKRASNNLQSFVKIANKTVTYWRGCVCMKVAGGDARNERGLTRMIQALQTPGPGLVEVASMCAIHTLQCVCACACMWTSILSSVQLMSRLLPHRCA